MPPRTSPIPAWQLYGEDTPFPDLLHVERIVDRAAGLDWTIAPHRHLHLHQIFLIRSGRIALTLDGQAAQPATPLVLNLPPGVVHGFSFSAGTDGYVLTVPLRDHPELFGRDSETGAALLHPGLAAPPPAAEALFEDLLCRWSGAGPFRQTELRAGLALILCCVLGAVWPGVVDRTPAAGRLARFQALIRARLREHWPLARYAAALNVSPRHLSRLCLAEAGLSARACVEAETMREACRLLAYTRMPVQEIAWQLGFADPSYFSRSFRRSLGRAPQDYRQDLERRG